MNNKSRLEKNMRFNLLAILFIVFRMLYTQTIGIMISPPGTTTHSMGVAIAKVIVK